MGYIDYTLEGKPMVEPDKLTFTQRWKNWKNAVGQFRIVPSKSSDPKAPKASKLQLLRDMAEEGSSWVNSNGGLSTRNQPLKGYIAKGYVKVHSEDMSKPALATITVLGHQVLEAAR